MRLSHKLLCNYFYHLIWCTRLEACFLHAVILPQTQEQPKRPKKTGKILIIIFFMLQLWQRLWRICPAWYLQMPACLYISWTRELLLRMVFLLLPYFHAASTAVPPGKCNPDQLSWDSPFRLAVCLLMVCLGCGETIPPQLRLESLMLSKPKAQDVPGFIDFCSELWCSLMRQGSYSKTSNSTMKGLLYALLQWWLWLPISHNSLSSTRAVQTGLRQFLNDECWLERFPVWHNYSALMCNTQWSICISMGISVGLCGLCSK